MVGDLADLRRVTSQSVPDACPWSAHAMPTRKAVARQLGLPCVVAVDGLDDVAAGRDILLDGSAGRVFVRPDPETAVSAVTAYRASADRAARWTGLGATADGHRVEVLANVQDGTEAWAARRGPAEGVGLFRTELCFLDRESEPTAEEQMARYREVLDAYPEAKVVIRTLDAGSDKPLRFAGHVDEANPALGVRGFRIAARDSGLLDRQLDAIAAAADSGHAPWVMAAMISTAAEAKAFADQVRARGLVPGVMIEVPAAAIMTEAILEHVDFASIGTNDLAQYAMAADRIWPACSLVSASPPCPRPPPRSPPSGPNWPPSRSTTVTAPPQRSCRRPIRKPPAPRPDLCSRGDISW